MVRLAVALITPLTHSTSTHQPTNLGDSPTYWLRSILLAVALITLLCGAFASHVLEYSVHSGKYPWMHFLQVSETD